MKYLKTFQIKKIFIIILFLLLKSCMSSIKFEKNHHNKKDVTIYRDEWGVPHIYGKHDTDVAFGLAYANAEDNLDNIIFSLSAARGKLGEYYGKDNASNDYLVQLVGLWEILEDTYHLLDNKTIALCNAYADGINHYLIKNQPKNVPLSIYPLTGKDIVAGFMHKTPFFFGLDEAITQVLNSEYPKQKTLYSEFSNVYGESMGSNFFAVSPKRSKLSNTHFMSNTHQPWEGPTAWYEAHLNSEEGWNAVGGLFPGSPIILVGHNENLGWSHTVNKPDLIDVYELDIDTKNPDSYYVDGELLEFEKVNISFKVKIFGPIVINIKRTGQKSIFGPVFKDKSNKKYAIKFQGMNDVRVIEQWYKMNKSENFTQWKDAMSMMAIPSFNTGYADKLGNIFYVYNAKFPKREDGYSWEGIVPGNTRKTLWRDYVSFSELPHVINPESGFIQNCNSSPFQTTFGKDNPKIHDYPESFGIENTMTNRALRSLELFENDTLVTENKLLKYKFDLKYSSNSNFAKIIEKTKKISSNDSLLLSAIKILQEWNLDTDIENLNTAFSVYCLYEYLELNPDEINLIEFSENILKTAKEFKKWFGGLEIPWGKVNRMIRGDLNLPLAGGPDVNHAIYGIKQKDGTLKAIAGDCYIIYFKWDKDGNIFSKSIHQYGTSNNNESIHYNDQSHLFSKRKLKNVYFNFSDVKKNAKRIYSLK